jgi:hypothetical protein
LLARALQAQQRNKCHACAGFPPCLQYPCTADPPGTTPAAPLCCAAGTCRCFMQPSGAMLQSCTTELRPDVTCNGDTPETTGYCEKQHNVSQTIPERFRKTFLGAPSAPTMPPERFRNVSGTFPGPEAPEISRKRSGNVVGALGAPGNVSRTRSRNVWETFCIFSQYPVVSGGSPLQDVTARFCAMKAVQSKLRIGDWQEPGFVLPR